MTTEVRVTIVAWVDDAQPGFVACRLIGADGREHQLIDKAPIFTAASLDRESIYPQPGWLTCTVLDRQRSARCAVRAAAGGGGRARAAWDGYWFGSGKPKCST
jgi:hypothetical protein